MCWVAARPSRPGGNRAFDSVQMIEAERGGLFRRAHFVPENAAVAFDPDIVFLGCVGRLREPAVGLHAIHGHTVSRGIKSSELGAGACIAHSSGLAQVDERPMAISRSVAGVEICQALTK